MVGQGVGVRRRGPCPICVNEGRGEQGGASDAPDTEVFPGLPSEGPLTPRMASTAVSPAVGFGPVGSSVCVFVCVCFCVCLCMCLCVYAGVCVCSSHETVISTRRHPAQPVSVPILECFYEPF